MQSLDELINSDEYRSMISEILSSPILVTSKREDARREMVSYMVRQVAEAYGAASEDEALDLWEDYIPVCIRRKDEAYSFYSVRRFCSVRVLLMNRAYCKGILTSCGGEDQSDINTCKSFFNTGGLCCLDRYHGYG